MEKKGVAKHSQITISVAKGEKMLTDALFELKILLSDLGNSEITAWIENELNGYPPNKGCAPPPYRKLKGTMLGTIQSIEMGRIINRRMVIPIKTDKMSFVDTYIWDNITSIEKYANDDSKSENRQIPVDLRVANSIADIELEPPYSQIISAGIIIPPSKYTDITNGVKQKILDILLLLEKTYGSINDYVIDFNSSKEKAKTAKQIINIVYNNSDNISVGDNNKIDKSLIGKENEN